MLNPDITLVAECGAIPPTIVTKCVEIEFRAEHHLTQLKDQSRESQQV